MSSYFVVERELKSGFLTNYPWKSDITAHGGYYDFRCGKEGDGAGELLGVMMHLEKVAMKLIRRTDPKKTLQQTVQDAINAKPTIRLVIDGGFAGMSTGTKAGAAFGNIQPPEDQTVDGMLVEDGKIVGGNPEPNKPFVAYKSNPAEGEPFTFGMGNPPSYSTAGIGGLLPMIVNRVKYDENKSAWYKSLKNAGGVDLGRTVLARSVSKDLLLACVQRDHSLSPGLELDQIRDKLFDAGIDDAVGLDGSASVFLNFQNEYKIKMDSIRSNVNTIALGFFYEPTVSG